MVLFYEKREKKRESTIMKPGPEDHRPPVSSLTTMRSTPSAISLFKVEASTNYIIIKR